MGKRMKAIKYMTMGVSFFAAVTAQAAIITTGGFGVDSNFIDNGLITTEYRADGTVWEWLDLAVTNGISFNSLVDDLNDDNTLNNSNTFTLNANDFAQDDVNALSAAQAAGWDTVSASDVVNMFNSFFGTSLSVGDTIRQPWMPLDDNTVVEDFIKLFGDTYHDDFIEECLTNSTCIDENPNLENIGSAYGMSNTIKKTPTIILMPNVYDGQTFDLLTDNAADLIDTKFSLSTDSVSHDIGTWLTREVKSVSEPATAVMFTLALMGLIVCRRRS